jgi:hypothetical protein
MQSFHSISPYKSFNDESECFVEGNITYPNKITRTDGYLMGFFKIEVVSKKIFKKWSERFFTLKEGILRIWKTRILYEKNNIPEMYVDLTRAFDNISINAMKKNNNNKHFINKYNISNNKTDNSFTIYEILKDSVKFKPIISILIHNDTGYKCLKKEIETILNTYF